LMGLLVEDMLNEVFVLKLLVLKLGAHDKLVTRIA